MRYNLRLTRALLIFLLTSILLSSLVVLIHSKRKRVIPNDVPTIPHDSLIIPSPLVLGIALLDRPPPLNQSTRMEVYNFIIANPGIHFRGICNGLNLPVGAAQYHLGVLTKAGLVSFFRSGRYKRYFRSKEFVEEKKKIISILKHKTAGKILSILTEKELLSHNDLASKLGISPQALTWQISRLRRNRLIDLVTEGINVRYFLDKDNAAMVKWCSDYVARAYLTMSHDERTVK